MKIVSQQPLSTSPVSWLQAQHLAICIDKLVKSYKRMGAKFDAEKFGDDPLRDAPAFKAFINACYICAFVCNDLVPDYPIREASRQLSLESFPGVRHYVHTLARAERSADMDFAPSPVAAAIENGCLQMVATRLRDDVQMYEQTPIAEDQNSSRLSLIEGMWWESASANYQLFRGEGNRFLVLDMPKIERSLYDGDGVAYRLLKAYHMMSNDPVEQMVEFKGAPRTLLAALHKLHQLSEGDRKTVADDGSRAAAAG